MIGEPAVLGAALVREAGLDPRRLRLGPIDVRAVAVGWATVELDRAATELPPSPARAIAEAAPDELLGATVRLVTGAPDSDDGSPIGLVLVEPWTEGPLTASLARRGEGPLVLYLAPRTGDLRSAVERLAAVGIRSRAGRGPFGAAALVLGGPVGGPLLVLVAVPSEP